MTEQEIFKKIELILKNKLQITLEINRQTALLQDEILDSLDFMKYLTCIEAEFNIQISDEDVYNSKLELIENMVLYIHQK